MAVLFSHIQIIFQTVFSAKLRSPVTVGYAKLCMNTTAWAICARNTDKCEGCMRSRARGRCSRYVSVSQAKDN